MPPKIRNDPLETRADRIISEMEKQGRIITLTPKESARIDHDLAEGFASIKQEFWKREHASIEYAKDVESGRINFYERNLTNLYQRIKNYFSRFFNILKWEKKQEKNHSFLEFLTKETTQTGCLPVLIKDWEERTKEYFSATSNKSSGLWTRKVKEPLSDNK